MEEVKVDIGTISDPIVASFDNKEGILKDLLAKIVSVREERKKTPAIKKRPTPTELSYRSPTSAKWMESYYSASGNKLQYSNQSRKNRFPLIFDRVKELKPDAKRVLSFGCSTGEEIQSLADRFPNAELIGVDIDNYAIQTARRGNKLPNVYFHDELGGLGKFDVATALMTFFCVSTPIPKERWAEALTKLKGHIAEDGILAIYTSDYEPMTILGDEFEVVRAWMREHNVNHKQYFNGYYKRKRSNGANP